MTKFNRKNTLLASSALVAAGFAMSFSTPAIAACSPNPATTGDTVLCSSIVNSGYTISAPDITLTIEEGSTLNSPGSLIPALSIEADNANITNNGTISTEYEAGHIILVTGNSIQITNNGLVRGQISAIGSLTDFHLLNSATGKIEGGMFLAVSSGTFNNQGTITEGVRFFGSNNMLITNTGTIGSFDPNLTFALDLSSANSSIITNELSGEIRVLNGVAVLSPTSSTGNTFINYGSIVAGSTDTINTVINYPGRGAIGGSSGAGYDKLINKGSIITYGGFGVSIAVDPNAVNQGEYNISNQGSVEAYGPYSIGIAMFKGTFLNEGTVYASGANARALIINSMDGVSINNSSIIAEGENSIALDLISTYGEIFQNNGSILASGINSTAIKASPFGSTTLYNFGSIEGENGLIVSGPSNGGFNLINNGIINGNLQFGDKNSTYYQEDPNSSLNGNIYTGAGADQVHIYYGTLNGDVNLELGDDLILIKDKLIFSGSIDGGAGIDQISFFGDENFQFNLGNLTNIEILARTEGSGKTTLSGQYSLSELWIGNGELELSNASISTDLLGLYGAGYKGTLTIGKNSSLTHTGCCTGGALNAGSLQLNNHGIFDLTNGGTANNTLYFNSEVNHVTNSGAINGAVDLGDGDDSYTWVSGGTHTSTIDGGFGTDSLYLNGFTSMPDTTSFLNFENLHFAGGTDIDLTADLALSNLTVSDASVAVNTHLTAPVTLSSGGELSGTGLITGNVVNGGNINPGNSIGNLFITGNYVQTAEGSLTIETNGITSDTLAIIGSATLDGALNVNLTLGPGEVVIGGYRTFLNASEGISGAFSSVNISSGNFLTYKLISVFNGSTVTKIMLQAQRSSFLQPFYSTQQTAVASVLNNVKTTSGTAGVFVKDLTFSYRGIAGRMMDQLISDAAPNMVTPALKARSAFMENVTDRAAELLDQPSVTGRWTANVAGFGQFGDSGSGGQGFNYSTGGASAMALYGLNENTALGFAMGASNTTMNMAIQGGGNDRTGLDIAGFATWNKSAIKLSAMAGVSYDSFETSRTILSQNINATARGNNSAMGLTAAINARYDGQVMGMSVRPEIGLRAMNLNVKAYDETGVDNLGLRFGSHSVSSVQPHAGLNLSKSFKLDNGWQIRPALAASYERELSDRDRSLNAAFIATPNNPFMINGVAADRSTTRINAGMTAKLNNGMSFRMGYEGSFGDLHKVHGLEAAFRINW